MRISLLLKREPFGEILEKTLATYWTVQMGQEVQVKWQTGRPRQDAGVQTWLANIYLNAIFTSQLEPAAFDPIRREFSYSPIAWRRPLQRAYVAAATSTFGSFWLAQASVQVSPPMMENNRLLIVPGNHKIRLLDHRKQESTLLLKAGFPDHFWQQELQARKLASQSGLPVPEMVDTPTKGHWYTERYISGTPLNRLPDIVQAQQALARISTQLARFYEHTLEEIDLTAYVNELGQQIDNLVVRNNLLRTEQIQIIQRQSQILQRRLSKNGKKVTTCLVHGDFQPANILKEVSKTWLIDWEYAAQRQAGYDALVCGLGARVPHGLANRLRNFITDGLPEELPLLSPWKGLSERKLSVDLFCLEELQLHLKENDNSLFTRLGNGLLILLDEIGQWLG